MRFKFLVGAVLTLGLAASANASLINGDFENGLVGWDAYDDVAVTAGVATVGDDSAWGVSTLAQASNTGTNTVSFEFDFLADISADVPSGYFPDFFASSLYFTNDIAAFDLLGGVYDDNQWMFDVDGFGEILYEGEITDSSVGTGWRHFSFEFVSSYDYVIAVFDVFDLNGVVDSSIQIDNVSLASVVASVPEPSGFVLLLIALGLGGLGGLVRKKST